MNVKELIEKIEALPAENYKYRPYIDKKVVLALVRQLDEPQKVTIPQFVAVWIEECKAKGKNLLRALLYTPEKVNSWVDDPDNQEIFALAWMFGYTVENEKRYTVVMKETKQPLYYNAVDKKLFFSMGGLATNFTQQQLEKLNFGWIFFCPGIEINEVID